MSKVVEIAKKLFDLIDEKGTKLTQKGNLPLKIMSSLTNRKISEDVSLEVRLTKSLLLFANLLEIKKNKIYVIKKIENEKELFDMLLNSFKNPKFGFIFNEKVIFFEKNFINYIIYIFQQTSTIDKREFIGKIFEYLTQQIDSGEIGYFYIFEAFFICFGFIEKQDSSYKTTKLFEIFPTVRQIEYPKIVEKRDFENFKDIDIIRKFVEVIKEAVFNVTFNDVDKETKYKLAIINFIEEMLFEQNETILKEKYEIIVNAFCEYTGNKFNIKKFSYIFQELEEIFTKLGEPSNSVKESFELLTTMYFDLLNSSKKEANKRKKDFFTILIVTFLEIYGYYNIGMFQN